MSRVRINPLSPIGERLTAAIAWRGFKEQQAFRESTSTTLSTFRNVEIGASVARLNAVSEWASVLGVDQGWLGFGGAYPEFKRGACCAMVISHLPPTIVRLLGRAEEIAQLGDASGATVAEWADIVRAWIEHTEADLPLLLEEVLSLQSFTPEFDSSRTQRFYPGLAQFLAEAEERKEVPTPEERELLMAIQFPQGVRPPVDAYRALWQSIRARPPRKA